MLLTHALKLLYSYHSSENGIIASLHLSPPTNAMFTRPAQHLAIQAPSSTTVSYTVYSSSPELTPSSRFLVYFRITLRLIICINLILINAVTIELVFAPEVATSHLSLLRPGVFESIAWSVSQVLDWRLLGLFTFLILYLCSRRRHTGASPLFLQTILSCKDVDVTIEESLLVLRGLGIQTSTSSPYLFSTSTTTFIPTTQIQDIVIHEAFKGLEVRFYLAVIVEGATEVVVVFPVGLSLVNKTLFNFC